MQKHYILKVVMTTLYTFLLFTINVTIKSPTVRPTGGILQRLLVDSTDDFQLLYCMSTQITNAYAHKSLEIICRVNK